LVGLPVVFGDDRAPTSVYVQVPGAGLQMPAALFEKELARSASMRTVMLRYAHTFFSQVASRRRPAPCNGPASSATDAATSRSSIAAA
jgi:hypothetical protein